MGEETTVKGLFEAILVPIAGSEHSISALNTAIGLAKSFGGRLIIVHVVDVDLVSDIVKFQGKTSQEVKDILERNGCRYLDFAKELADKSGVEAETILDFGVPYERIVKVADKRKATLIITGRTGPQRISMRTVTERVIQFAKCPVLVAVQEETTWNR